MCGITGIYDLKQQQRISTVILQQMRDKLIHRGPDDASIQIRDNLGLATRRLSIIDLANGNQPFWNEDQSIVLICNGEVFNYLELRARLQRQGYQFKTQSDCEVILALYQEQGLDFLNEINGQFAFVIYDFNKKILFAARDHFGIIPFFYTVTPDGLFIFASEIKAILEHPSVPRKVNRLSLDQVLTFPGAISPNSMFESIHSLPNGHSLLIKGQDAPKIKEYWDLKYPKKDNADYSKPDDYYIATLAELFERSVNYRLRADVPIGFYISGGLDSAMIAGKACQLQQKHRHSFSINVQNDNLSEARYQRQVVTALGTKHYEHIFNPRDILNGLKTAVYHSESPLKETYNTASLLLSKFAKDANVKVILTGEGADEFFAGYIGYRYDQMSGGTSFNQVSEEELTIRETLWGNQGFNYEKNYTDFHSTKLDLYSTQSYELAHEATRYSVLDRGKISGLHTTHLRSYVDYKLRLSDHLLGDHGDRMALANGVECRYPFLDKDLIEFAITMPPSLLVRDFNEKYILKQIAQKYVPPSIINRDKFAFATHSSIDLLKLNDEYINDLLSFSRIKREGYFNPVTVQRLKNQYLHPDFRLRVPYEPDLLITVISFGMFLELFNMPHL